MKYYHFYANGRDVKEISEEQFRNQERRDVDTNKNIHLLVQDFGYALAFHHGKKFLWIPMRQLSQVLGFPPVLPVEPQQNKKQENPK